jgi:ketosteroid isomerase-like protein
VTTSANLDLVRSIFADWGRGDYGSTEWAHPEIEFVIADGPEPGTWTGLAGLAEWTRGFLSVWEDARVQADELRELDDEHVLVLVGYSGRGKRSGLDLGPMEPKGTWLFRVRDRKVTRLLRYWDRDRAFADLGLAPGSAGADAAD